MTTSWRPSAKKRTTMCKTTDDWLRKCLGTEGGYIRAALATAPANEIETVMKDLACGSRGELTSLLVETSKINLS